MCFKVGNHSSYQCQMFTRQNVYPEVVELDCSHGNYWLRDM